jgi:hypothetical protein
MEGNMRGPSTQDCEKSLAGTGLESVNLKSKKASAVPRSNITAFIPLAQLRTKAPALHHIEQILALH